jgi:fructuronate reductase
LRSGTVAEQLNPQNGLYSVLERSGSAAQIRVIGAIREVIVAFDSGARLAGVIAAPGTQIVTLTVTEKGYCRAPDGSLDPVLADERSIYAHLAMAMDARRRAGLAGLTLLSCDNLAGNGEQLQRLMCEYLDARAPVLRAWFEAECACPSSMVDRIVPATTQADRAEAAALLGLDDAAAVATEPFSQWVIEDRFAGRRPTWERVGAQLVTDIRPYETAKLRMLNGAHSALAYLGLERGHTYVHEAIADRTLRPLVEQLMRDEAATSFEAAPGQDLEGYADALLARFGNPALNHRLQQIAMDGSQKLPQRWLQTLEVQRRKGKRCPAILAALGAWIRHIRDGVHLDDPLAAELRRTVDGLSPPGAAAALFATGGLLGGGWQPDATDLDLLARTAPSDA